MFSHRRLYLASGNEIQNIPETYLSYGHGHGYRPLDVILFHKYVMVIVMAMVMALLVLIFMFMVLVMDKSQLGDFFIQLLSFFLHTLMFCTNISQNGCSVLDTT